MLQFRPPGSTQPMYSPQRDILYLLPELLAQVPMQVMQGHCKHTAKMCQDYGVTQEDLENAVEAYTDFLANSHTAEYGPKIADAFSASKWDACHPIARLAVLQYISRTLTYVAWKSVREATRKDGESAMTTTKLARWTEEALRYSRLNWLQRLIYRWRSRNRSTYYEAPQW